MLSFLKEHKCTKILEIGTAIGYSAIRMALLDESIEVDTIERDEERYHIAVENVKKQALKTEFIFSWRMPWKLRYRGHTILYLLMPPKRQYIRFFERYVPFLMKDGFVLSDNLGFHGMVEGTVEAKVVRHVHWCEKSDPILII